MSDRLIKIYVGESEEPGSDKPFLIPQSTLYDASEYFVKAIKNEHLGFGESGVLRFPTDDREIWKIMLYWVVKRELSSVIDRFHPTEDTELLIVRLWIARDQYAMADFQDLVMLELLYAVEERGVMTGLDVLLAAFCGTLSKSPLRRLAAEQLVSSMYAHNTVKQDELEAFDGIPGALRDFAIACDESRDFCTIFMRENVGWYEGQLSRYTTFMVGSGPEAHWVLQEGYGEPLQ